MLYEPIEIGGDEKRVTAPDPNYVVIRWLERLKEPRSPSGQWTKYYLWNLEPALAEALFDRAAEIYPDKPIERIKARIAVTMICSHFQKCRKQGRRPKSHTMLEKMFGELLVDEAAWRLAANEITFRQSQLLSRVNISGSVKSLDPADPKALLSAQPGSWFYKLLSGTNKTILPHIRAEALKDQPDLPLFMDD